MLFKRNIRGVTMGTLILGGTFSKKPPRCDGGTFNLGGTFHKNLCEAYRVRLLERVRLFGTR